MENDPARRALALGVWAPLLFAGLLAVAYEIGARQTDAYLGPGLGLPRRLGLVLLLGGAAVGFGLGRRLLRAAVWRSRLLMRLLSGLSCLCALSGASWFWAYGAAEALPGLAGGLLSGAGLLVGSCAGALAQALALPYRELQAIRLLLAPVPLVATLALTLLLSALLSYAGLWRAAAVLGALLAGLTWYLPRFADYLGDRRPAPRRPAVVALAASACSLAVAQAHLPARLLSRYPSEVVWTNGESVVISAQNTFELFELNQLRLSSADDYRFAELTVHPVMASLPAPKRVLLLGPGGGYLEREVLRYASVTEVVSVSELDERAFRATLWPRHDSPLERVRFQRAEPLPWLEAQGASFDAIIVALPAPAVAGTAKHYSRYFYELLATRLTPGGAVAVLAGSSENRRTVAIIASTMRRAGFVLDGYEAPVPLLGSLAFVVGALGGPPELSRARLPAGLRYLDDASLRRALTLSVPGAVRSDDAAVSTLDRLRVSEIWHEEQVVRGRD